MAERTKKPNKRIDRVLPRDHDIERALNKQSPN